jgi:hypothetical protein
MFTPARQLDEVDAQIYAQQYKDKKSAAAKQAARDKLRQDAAAEDYGVTDFFKDSGIDLTKGVAGLGEAYVGCWTSPLAVRLAECLVTWGTAQTYK